MNKQIISTLVALINQVAPFEYGTQPASGGNYVVTVAHQGHAVTTATETIYILTKELARFTTKGF